MTAALVKELKDIVDAAAKLPPEEQRALASIIQDEMRGEARWEELLRDPRSDDLLGQLVARAKEQEQHGLSEPLDPPAGTADRP